MFPALRYAEAGQQLPALQRRPPRGRIFGTANHAPLRNSMKTKRGRKTQGPLWVREFREFRDSEDFRDYANFREQALAELELALTNLRSEERRVGKACECEWWRDDE